MRKLSRRQFLANVAMAGGSLAVYNSSLALDLISSTEKLETLQLKPAQGTQTIAILGGGIAGLAVAHELGNAGYQVVILEASHRVGGRNLTLRHGDFIDELGNPNYCQFDDQPNLYMNAGPARIPGHHRRLLHYCKKFEVPLSIKANHNRLAYAHDSEAGPAALARQEHYVSDARGFLAELAWKSLDPGAFDKPLTPEDMERLADFVAGYGDLDKSGKYKGTYRAGATTDRMLTHGPKVDPMPIDALLQHDYWHQGETQMEVFDWLSPLMEAKGGMDKIVDGFARNVKANIILKAQVQAIEVSDTGVNIVYQHDNTTKTLQAEYCFNNIPANFLPGIPNNFSQSYNQVLASFRRQGLFKIGFQMKERFWEKDGIYGGISYTNDRINQIWYPGHDIHQAKGIMLGAYIWNQENIEYFSALPLEERLAVAAKQGAAIHPNYESYIENGVSVAWNRMNNMMGCGTRIPRDKHEEYFPMAQAAENNRHFLIGDQVSFHPGWQEGALASAETALLQFNRIVKAA